jgi:CBS domain-containing protein
VLDSQLTVGEASQLVQRAPSDVFLVRLAASGWGSLDRDLFERLTTEGKSEVTLESLVSAQSLPYLYPDYPLEMALRYVEQTPLVPVVSRADLGKLEGIITSEDVLARYRVAAEGE